MRRTRPPKIVISNRQTLLRLNSRVVRRVLREAWKTQTLHALCSAPRACVAASQSRPRSTLHVPSELSVVFVTDAEIARINMGFLGHPGPTDVITFQHGEIIISTERAVAQAKKFKTDVVQELALYLTHGLLHLTGYDDTTASTRSTMTRRQRWILQRVRKKLDLHQILR